MEGGEEKARAHKKGQGRGPQGPRGASLLKLTADCLDQPGFRAVLAKGHVNPPSYNVCQTSGCLVQRRQGQSVLRQIAPHSVCVEAALRMLCLQRAGTVSLWHEGSDVSSWVVAWLEEPQGPLHLEKTRPWAEAVSTPTTSPNSLGVWVVDPLPSGQVLVDSRTT